MKFGYITIMIRDMEKSVAFYEKAAELQVVRRFCPPIGEIVFMSGGDGATMLEFIQSNQLEKVETKGLVMSFAVDGSLEEKRSQLEALGFSPSPVIEMPPKPRHFTLTDPDGICIEITE